MKKFIKGNFYSFKKIEKQVKKSFGDKYVIDEQGPNLIGANFLTLRSDSDLVCSFVLTGCSGQGNHYECIYNDWR